MTASPPTHDAVAETALGRMTVLQQVASEAVQAGSKREFIFTVLNRTVVVARYDRAYAWELRSRPRLLGASGVARVNPKSIEAEKMAAVVSSLDSPKEAVLMPFPNTEGEKTRRLLWQPLPSKDGVRYGLLLVRHDGPEWSPADIDALHPLAEVFGNVFRLFDRTRAGRSGSRSRFFLWLGVAATLLLALAFVRLPLRIVAPCEVVATNPYPVNAPLDGVIRTVNVRPGSRVRIGDALYAYDDDIARDELSISLKQVEVARSNLERVLAQAVSDRSVRAEARMLQSRLAQEELRLAAIREKMTRLAVSAPCAGTVIMGDPAGIIGKPIRLGEEVLFLADEKDSRLRIWLPQDDRIDFRPDQDIKIFLHADSGRSRRASLVYVASHAQAGAEGVYGFLAEAEWSESNDDIKLGLRGTAVLYGNEVSLGYWLIRKPLAAVRRFVGI